MSIDTLDIKYDCWSCNGENYYSDFSDIIDELEVGDTIYEGVMATPCNKQWVDADRIIEDIQCNAQDDCGELAEYYLTDISKEAMQELSEIITAWANRQEIPSFWSVVNVRERTITEEDME